MNASITDSSRFTTDSDGQWITAEFSSPVKLVAGTDYYIMAKGTGASAANNIHIIGHQVASLPSDYTGGIGWTSSNSGVSWGSSNKDDYFFREYGLDLVLPTLPTVSINNGNYSTIARAVTLTLHSDDATTMQFRNETSSWSTNETYGTSKAWNLSIGYGTKNVSVRFWNANGSASAYDTIAYVDAVTTVTNPYPANASTGISLLPHMNITLGNYSHNTRLRVFTSYYSPLLLMGGGYVFWGLSYNVTVSSNGVKWFNLTTPLTAGTQYCWFVEVMNTTSLAITYFPQSGTIITPGTFDIGFDTPHHAWLFNTTSISLSLSINHPVDDSVETEASWKGTNEHNLVFNITNNTLSHSYYVYMTAKVRLKGTSWRTMNEVRVTSVPETNGDVVYDLSTYTPYSHAEYNITLRAYDYTLNGDLLDDASYRAFLSPNANVTMNFTLGSPVSTTKNQRFSIRSCDPPANDNEGIDAVSYGFRCQVAVNTTTGTPEMFFFVCDDEGNVLTYGTRMSTDACFQDYTIGLGKFEPRKHYIVVVGYFWDGTKSASCVDWGTLPLSTTETHDFYDDTCQLVGNFSYEWMNFDIPKTYRIFLGAGADSSFYGYRIMFWTYPAGESPPTGGGTTDPTDTSTGSTWGHDNIGQLETNTGITGLMIIAGLIIVALFAIMPYLIIKKKGQNVPTPIFAFFGLFGAVLSYGMGLFPLWFFILPTFFCIFIIIYKLAGWVLANKELVTAEGKK
jgi:hypothetical protein